MKNKKIWGVVLLCVVVIAADEIGRTRDVILVQGGNSQQSEKNRPLLAVFT